MKFYFRNGYICLDIKSGEPIINTFIAFKKFQKSFTECEFYNF